MLRSIGPLHIGHSCDSAANSSRTHALQSALRHFHIFVGISSGLVSSEVVKRVHSFLMSGQSVDAVPSQRQPDYYTPLILAK